MKKMTFLVNPRGTRRVASRKRRKAATKRKPPKGFSSWKAYMASIRPNSGGKMAARKRRKSRKTVTARRRRRSPVRTNPPRRRTRYRRNPMGLSVGGVKNILVGGIVDAAFGVGGKTAVRLVRSKLGFDGATTVGAAVEIGSATVLGIVAAKALGAQRARAVVQGAFMGPIETFLKAANLPFVSSALGDEGDFAGVESDMGGYVRDGLSGYTSLTEGGASGAAMGDEVGDEVNMY